MYHNIVLTYLFTHGYIHITPYMSSIMTFAQPNSFGVRVMGRTWASSKLLGYRGWANLPVWSGMCYVVLACMFDLLAIAI